MKKGKLLNSELSSVISKMGHKDSIVIGDAGLPVQNGVKLVDLAVTRGVPGFIEVLGAVLSEQRVEKIIMAEEIKSITPILHSQIVEMLDMVEEKENIIIEKEYVSHENFKLHTKDCKCSVRTGEFTPYANIILISGVVF